MDAADAEVLKEHAKVQRALEALGQVPLDGQGFGGHRMLGGTGLVHMGGRLYDPATGRFLSADPFVQEPNNLQNYNRYTYVLNNPLSYVDPSGYIFKKIGRALGKVWKAVRPFVGTVITVALTMVGVPACYRPN